MKKNILILSSLVLLFVNGITYSVANVQDDAMVRGNMQNFFGNGKIRVVITKHGVRFVANKKK